MEFPIEDRRTTVERLWETRECWICHGHGRCRHREYEYDFAELEAKERRLARIATEAIIEKAAEEWLIIRRVKWLVSEHRAKEATA